MLANPSCLPEIASECCHKNQVHDPIEYVELCAFNLLCWHYLWLCPDHLNHSAVFRGGILQLIARGFKTFIVASGVPIRAWHIVPDSIMRFPQIFIYSDGCYYKSTLVLAIAINLPFYTCISQGSFAIFMTQIYLKLKIDRAYVR